MTHKLAAGLVVLRYEMILLVKDRHGWSLPKGSTEDGETFLDTAKREAFEETGLKIAVGEVAFVTEYTSMKYGQYLQVYYSGNLISDEIQTQTQDPDEDVIEVKFVSVKDLRSYIKFRPWVIPLEKWIKEKELQYYTFNLDTEGYEI